MDPEKIDVAGSQKGFQRGGPDWWNSPSTIEVAGQGARIPPEMLSHLIEGGAQRSSSGRVPGGGVAGRSKAASEHDCESRRTVWPVAIGYFQAARLLVARCELRRDFRNFRTDRVAAAEFLDERYPERPAVLRTRWQRSLALERRYRPDKAAT